MSRTPRLGLESLEARAVPADLAYAQLLTGLPANAMTRVVGDAVGNLYVTGSFTGTIDLNPDPVLTRLMTANGGTDVFVAKYGYDGQLLWARQLDGQADETVADITLDNIGNVYVAGTFRGATDFNPNPAISAVGSAAQGGSAYIWKLDSQGDFFMARVADGTSSASGIAVDTNGNMLLAGTFAGTADFHPAADFAVNLNTTNANGAGFLWKLDSIGNMTWARKFETTGTLATAMPALDGAGYAYLSGRFTGTADLDPEDETKALVAGGTAWTPFVVKIGFTGDYVWGRTLRPITPTVGANNAITGLGVDGIGNVFAGGTLQGTVDFEPSEANFNLTSANDTTDGFIWKLNPGGTLGYARKFGGPNNETLADLFVHQSGFAYATGVFTGTVDFDPGAGVVNLGSGAGAADAYVIKLNPSGNLAYTKALGGGRSATRPSGLWADGAGNMYISGGVSGRADFEPANTISVVAAGNGSGFISKLWPAVGSATKPQNRPPTNLSAGGPYTIDEGKSLTIKAAAVDPEGQPLTFAWDLNGDGIYTDAIGKKVTLTRAQLAALGLADGNNVAKSIRVRIFDNTNLGVEAATTLTIKNLPPVGTIVAPATGTEGVRPIVKYVVTSDPSNKDLKAGFRASWDFNDDGVWDLGNGSTYAGSIAGKATIPLGFVSDSGPIQVLVRIFDKDGGYVDDRATIIINEAAPKAAFGPISALTSGSPVTFKFSTPVDSPSDSAAGFTYGFDFDNDGVFEVNGPSKQAATVFPGRGSFVVTGRIMDQDGFFTLYTLTVNVL